MYYDIGQSPPFKVLSLLKQWELRERSRDSPIKLDEMIGALSKLQRCWNRRVNVGSEAKISVDDYDMTRYDQQGRSVAKNGGTCH